MPAEGRHCVYLQQKTVNGNASYIKRRPCVILGIALDGNPYLRVRHTGETYGNSTTGIAPRSSVDANESGVYVAF